MSGLDPGLAAALSRVRRGEGGDDGARRAFTVARTEAVLKLRELPRAGPWAWTLALLRAANAVAPAARAFARERDEAEARVVTLTFSTAGFDVAGVELRGLVLAAAEGGSGDMSEEPAAKWRRLVGSAVNAALAGQPTAVEVRTAGGAVRYVRKDSPGAGQDPYGEQRSPGRCPPQAFEVEVQWPRPGFGRRLASWLARQARAEEALTELWRSALFGAEPTQTAGRGIELGRPLPGLQVSLGTHAVWGAAPKLAGPWLVREGVRIVSLAPALARAGLDAREVAGWIDCPALRPTADETSVAVDAGLELLVAWLLDARAHSAPAQGEPGFVVQWPTEVSHLPTVSGRPAPLDQVILRCRQGRDLLYVWPHQAEMVPAAIRARVHALWPSELAVVVAKIPEARPVPARALGDSPQFDRADLSNLIKGALPPVPIDLEAEATVTVGEVQARIELQAYVHRFASAEVGAIAILAHERRVAHVREPARVITGATLVASLVGEPADALSIDALRGEKGLLQSIADRCRAAAGREIGRLLAQALTHASPWELPLVRAQAAGLTGAALGVRYRARREDGALELSWEESPLLGLPVGHDLAGAPVTLLRALERCRDVGGIVVEDPRQPWTSLRSSDPRHEPWALAPEGRELLARVVGVDVLWDMPAVAEAHLLPAPAEAQRGLVLEAGAVAQRIEQRSPRARAELRAHVLVAEALAVPATEVVDAPVFVRYDPRALDPLRVVSRSDARAEGLPLVPTGSASRGLAGPALLVGPGEARLLHAAGHAAGAVSGAIVVTPRTARAPIRRAGAAEAPLCVLPVADPLALGALRIEARSTKIAVWGGGLHVDDIGLPAPLDWIGGRLSLTRQGTRAGGERLLALVKLLARAIARRALRERLLHPPGAPQRAGLDEFRARLLADASAVPEVLREETGPEEHALSTLCAQSMTKHPPRRLLGGPRRFEGLLRQALVRPVAVETALLSWTAGSLREVDGKGWTIELGRRNAEVQRGLASEAADVELFAPAALVVAQVFAEARARKAAGAEPVEELVAGYRLLALLYAHLP